MSIAPWRSPPAIASYRPENVVLPMLPKSDSSVVALLTAELKPPPMVEAMPSKPPSR